MSGNELCDWVLSMILSFYFWVIFSFNNIHLPFKVLILDIFFFNLKYSLMITSAWFMLALNFLLWLPCMTGLEL